MGRSQNINWNRNLEEFEFQPSQITEGFKTPGKEVTADVAQMAIELDRDVESEDMTELLQSHDKP